MKWYCIIVLCLMACDHQNATSSGAERKRTDTVSHHSRKASHTKIKVGKINLQQTTIEGCSGLFREGNRSFSGLEYSFATDLQQKAFIVINDKKIELSKKNSSNSENAVYEEYTGEGYQIILDVKKIKRLGDELWHYKGTLTIEKEGISKLVAITGEIGC